MQKKILAWGCKTESEFCYSWMEITDLLFSSSWETHHPSFLVYPHHQGTQILFNCRLSVPLLPTLTCLLVCSWGPTCRKPNSSPTKTSGVTLTPGGRRTAFAQGSPLTLLQQVSSTLRSPSCHFPEYPDLYATSDFSRAEAAHTAGMLWVSLGQCMADGSWPLAPTAREASGAWPGNPVANLAQGQLRDGPAWPGDPPGMAAGVPVCPTTAPAPVPTAHRGTPGEEMTCPAKHGAILFCTVRDPLSHLPGPPPYLQAVLAGWNCRWRSTEIFLIPTCNQFQTLGHLLMILVNGKGSGKTHWAPEVQPEQTHHCQPTLEARGCLQKPALNFEGTLCYYPLSHKTTTGCH